MGDTICELAIGIGSVEYIPEKEPGTIDACGADHCCGMVCIDVCGADICGADICGADICGADICSME